MVAAEMEEVADDVVARVARSGAVGWAGEEGEPSDIEGGPTLPFKANAGRRHHIPRQRHRVTNWSEYEAGLRARGRLTIWFTAEAIEAWRAEPRTGRGGQPKYSDLAIRTALM
ncbi:MAG TPA: transposase, partial [Crenalkalicoccus sp.]|nr:transposase [Crenalkalicoccus sp.]